MARRVGRVFGFVAFAVLFAAWSTTSAPGAVVSGHYTSDHFQHAIAAVDGTLHEIFFDPARGSADGRPPPSGSLKVTRTRSTLTKYMLTARSPVGQDSRE